MKFDRVFLIAACLALFLAACAREETASTGQAEGPVGADQPVASQSRTLDQRVARGGKLYAAHCAACHQVNGQGLGGAFPPLAGSDYLANGSPAVVVEVVLKGLSGPITVNGQAFNSVMPSLSYLSDGDVADIVTFVFNAWGNPGGEVSAAEVTAARGGE